MVTNESNFTLQLKCDGTRWRTGGEVKGKLANGVGSQYPSHYLGTWCIQHYYRWCAHLGWTVVDWTDALPPTDLNGLVRFAERRNLVSARVTSHFNWSLPQHAPRRLQLKCDGTRWRTGGEVKGKLAKGVGSQYPSHYLGTWCFQHYYRWCAHLGWPVVDWTDAPCGFKWTRPISPKDKISFLHVCHHISTGPYIRPPVCLHGGHGDNFALLFHSLNIFCDYRDDIAMCMIARSG